MPDTIWKPGKQIKSSALMLGQNVAQIGSVKNILEGGEDFDPYRRSILGGDESVEGQFGIPGRDQDSIPCRVEPY